MPECESSFTANHQSFWFISCSTNAGPRRVDIISLVVLWGAAEWHEFNVFYSPRHKSLRSPVEVTQIQEISLTVLHSTADPDHQVTDKCSGQQAQSSVQTENPCLTFFLEKAHSPTNKFQGEPTPFEHSFLYVLGPNFQVKSWFLCF